MITIILILMLSIPVFAPAERCIYIERPEEIQPYEKIWNATCEVESGFDAMAIGDKHLEEHSYGIVQIRKARLSDYYNKTGVMYSERDMFDPAKAKRVFLWYCSGTDMEVIARTWNGGEKGMSKKSTVKYWKLIKAKL